MTPTPAGRLDIEGAKRNVRAALDGLWLGNVSERGIIDYLTEALGGLGESYTPPNPMSGAIRLARAARRSWLPLVTVIAAVVFAVALLLYAEGGREELVVAPPAERELSESYEFKQIQVGFARRLLDTFALAFGDRSNYVDSVGVRADNWAVDRQRVQFGNFNNDHGGVDVAVTWTAVHYAAGTVLNYGTPRVAEGELANRPGRSLRVDNREGTTPDTEHIEQSFTIAQSVGSEFATDFSFDASVSSETTVKGGTPLAGVEFEQKITATFGTHFGQSETRTKEQSTEQTDTVSDELGVPPGQDVITTFANHPITTLVPFDVDGVIDGKITITFWDWTSWRDSSLAGAFAACIATDHNNGWVNRTAPLGGNSAAITFASVGELADALYGVHVDWSALGSEQCQARIDAASVAAIESTAHRQLTLSGTQTRESESAITMTIYRVDACSPDDADALEARSQGAFTGDLLDAQPSACAEVLRTVPSSRKPAD